MITEDACEVQNIILTNGIISDVDEGGIDNKHNSISSKTTVIPNFGDNLTTIVSHGRSISEVERLQSTIHLSGSVRTSERISFIISEVHLHVCTSRSSTSMNLAEFRHRSLESSLRRSAIVSIQLKGIHLRSLIHGNLEFLRFAFAIVIDIEAEGRVSIVQAQLIQIGERFPFIVSLNLNFQSTMAVLHRISHLAENISRSTINIAQECCSFCEVSSNMRFDHDFVCNDAVAMFVINARINLFAGDRISNIITIGDNFIFESELEASRIVNRRSRNRITEEVNLATSRTTVAVDSIHAVGVHVVRIVGVCRHAELEIKRFLGIRSNVTIRPQYAHPFILLNTNPNGISNAVLISSRISIERSMIDGEVNRIDREDFNFNRSIGNTTRVEILHIEIIETVVDRRGVHIDTCIINSVVVTSDNPHELIVAFRTNISVIGSSSADLSVFFVQTELVITIDGDNRSTNVLQRD